MKGLVPAIVLLMVQGFSAIAVAQDPVPIFKSGVAAEVLDVRVTDANGKPVRGLKKENLHLLENEKKTEIEHLFANDSQSTDLMLVLDSTMPWGWVQGNFWTLENMKTIAGTFAERTLHFPVRISIPRFRVSEQWSKDTVYRWIRLQQRELLDFSSDPRIVRRKISRISAVEPYGTPISPENLLEMIDKFPQTTGTQKVILLVSPRLHFLDAENSRVAEAAASKGIMIYAVTSDDWSEPAQNELRRHRVKILTQGHVSLIPLNAPICLDRAFGKITESFQADFRLGFYPGFTDNGYVAGATSDIRVFVENHPEYRVTIVGQTSGRTCLPGSSLRR